MPSENATVAIYETPGEAAWAIQELREAGFDVTNVSVAGKDCGTGDAAVCYYRTGAEVRCLGQMATFWNGVWEQLPGWALVTIPAIGAVLVSGPLAEWIVVAMENAAIFTGLTALGAGLYSIGFSREAIVEYEAAVGSGKFLVVAHGPSGEVARARRILQGHSLGAKR